jgi:hypothetical protein
MTTSISFIDFIQPTHGNSYTYYIKLLILSTLIIFQLGNILLHVSEISFERKANCIRERLFSAVIKLSSTKNCFPCEGLEPPFLGIRLSDTGIAKNTEIYSKIIVCSPKIAQTLFHNIIMHATIEQHCTLLHRPAHPHFMPLVIRHQFMRPIKIQSAQSKYRAPNQNTGRPLATPQNLGL